MPQPSSQPSNAFAAEAFNLVNAYRVANGQAALRGDATINLVTGSYAKVFGDQNHFGHYGPDGSTPEGRLAAGGYSGWLCGEAIAAGQATAADAVAMWKSSAAHNAILLSPNPLDLGIGYYSAPGSTYKHYWVLMTGRTTALCPLS